MAKDLSIEVVQEIWRFPDLTFTVMYPTHDTCAVKGMRGNLTRSHYLKIKETLAERGFHKVLFERGSPADGLTTRILINKDKNSATTEKI